MALVNQGFKVRDAAVSPALLPLPTAGATVNTAVIDTVNQGVGDFLAESELSLKAPALTSTQLANTNATMTYNIQHVSDTNGTWVNLFASCIVQTGSTNGAVAVTFTARLPTGVSRYIRAQAVSAGSNAADCSGSSMQFDLLM